MFMCVIYPILIQNRPLYIFESLAYNYMPTGAACVGRPTCTRIPKSIG